MFERSQRTGDMVHEIIASYSDMVYRLAYARCGNRADAEDVYQDVFFRFFRANPKLENKEHLKAWLIRATIHTSVNLLKSAWKRRFKLDEIRTFELNDAVVTLKQLDIDTASTILGYEVRTSKVFAEDNPVGNGITYILFDQDGHPLNADCPLGMSASQIKNNDGQDVWMVSHSGNPIPETVTSITFVPTSNLKRMQESSNAYYLRMKDAASPKQCFTIEIS